MIHAIYIGLCFLTLAQLTYPFFSILLAQLFGKTNMKKKDNHPRRFDYACIITAYKNAAIAEPLVLSLLQQSYSNFTIYLVADEW